MASLSSPLQLGPYTLPNRVFFAPCTRCRADEDRAPHALNATYYQQRATGGLLISEASQISQAAIGYRGTPGMHTRKQVEGWKLVTEAVHQRGGRIFAQLWHCGSVSHSSFQPDGLAPFSSSAVLSRDEATHADGSKVPSELPRAMTIDDIRTTLNDYRHAAQCAFEAGFDGVELHGANGYLLDQFLRDGINRRTDEYGGSIPNRARFHLEAAKALCEVWGPSRVGVRLSPSGVFNHVYDTTPRETFGYAVTELGKLGLAYLHIMEAMARDLETGPTIWPKYEAIPASFFRPLFKGTLVTNAGFTKEKAELYLKEGWADAIAFGVAYIANPDLPERLAAGAALNTPDSSTFYSQGPRGYTDYPFMTKQ